MYDIDQSAPELNDCLEVFVLDDDAVAASIQNKPALYAVAIPHKYDDGREAAQMVYIKFQTGTPSSELERGNWPFNGISDEVLIAILEDRGVL